VAGTDDQGDDREGAYRGGEIAPAATEPSALESTPTPMTGSEFPAKPAT
jgi:hypothetical protein